MKISNKYINKILYIVMAISLVLVCFYILYCTRGKFTSDLASYLLLAKAQIDQKQFFPDGFYYSTGIFVFTPELIVLPLMSFVEDWVLCREIAVIVFDIIMFVLVFVFFAQTKCLNKRIDAALAIILLCLPMGHYFETYYEAAYITLIIYEIAIMLCADAVLKSEKEAKWYHYLLLLFTVYVANIEGVRNLVVIVLPIVVAMVVYMLFKNFFYKEAVVLKNNVLTIIITIIGAGLATITFGYLAQKVNLNSGMAGMVFVDKNQVITNFQTFVVNVLEYYGAIVPGDMLSVSGITACIGFVLFIICAVVSPLLFVFQYKKIKNEFLRFYVLYANISNFFVIYMMIFSNATTARYYHTVFWHNIVFTSIIVGYCITEYKNIIVDTIVGAVVIGTVCVLHYNYLDTTVKPLKQIYEQNEEKGTLIDFLKQNDLDYGFASFWNAYNNMALSNGDITVLSYIERPTKKYKWLVSKKWYDTSECKGRCFILLGPGEQVDEKYYECASEVKYYGNSIILIYDKHIYLYDELKKKSEPKAYLLTKPKETYQIPIGQSSFLNNAYYSKNIITIKNEGCWYGKNLNLNSGKYELQITCNDVELLDFDIVYSGNAPKVLYDNFIATDEGGIFTFSLDVPCDSIRIELGNMGDKDICIKNMMLEKVE